MVQQISKNLKGTLEEFFEEYKTNYGLGTYLSDKEKYLSHFEELIMNISKMGFNVSEYLTRVQKLKKEEVEDIMRIMKEIEQSNNDTLCPRCGRRTRYVPGDCCYCP